MAAKRTKMQDIGSLRARSAPLWEMPLIANEIEFLQDWYRRQCNGDWEHQYGVKFGTLDNPGWRLEVDLEGTELQGRTLDRQVVERSTDDWWQAWCDGAKFQAAAGSGNLAEIIDVFRAFVEMQASAP